MSRKALAELLGHSEEWLRLLEVEGRGAERLGTLIELARVLQLDDLSALAGYRFAATALELPEHPAVPEIRLALSRTLLASADARQAGRLSSLEDRICQAWTAWRVSHNQYTALGVLLPDLLRDAIQAARYATDGERRHAHVLLSHCYLLAQRFAFCVGARDLTAQCGDRALLAADVADDSELLALAGWSAAMTSLVAKRSEEATELSLSAAVRVADPENRRQAALRGSLLLFAAMGAAGMRQHADAWRHWDEAAALADRVGRGYQHPYTQFSGANVAIYGVALEIECGNASAAVSRAGQLNPADLPSTNRRAQHYIDLARSHQRRGEHDGALASLLASAAESQETIVFSADARQLVTDLVKTSTRRTADKQPGLSQLAAKLGVA